MSTQAVDAQIAAETSPFESLRRAVFTRAPVSQLFLLSTILVNLLRFPFFLIYYIPAFTRPHPQWTYRQAIKMRLVKAFIFALSFVENVTPLSLEPGTEGDSWQVVEKREDSVYQGILRSDPGILPEKTGATWYPQRPSKATEAVKMLVFHIHGGAFVISTGRAGDGGWTAKMLLKETGASHVLMPQYRLSCNPSCEFPAALQDVLTMWCYVTQELGIPGSRIIVSGDSAGGNAVLALLRYLEEFGEKLGLEKPKAAWLWSPWVNPSNAYRSTSHYNTLPTVSTDYLSDRFGTWGARKYAPVKSRSKLTIKNPYITFVGAPFSTTVPLFVQAGGMEVISVDIFKMYEEMRDVKGNRVELFINALAPHDITIAGNTVGFEEEAKEAARRASTWTKSLEEAQR